MCCTKYMNSYVKNQNVHYLIFNLFFKGLTAAAAAAAAATNAAIAEAMKVKKIKLEAMSSYHASNNQHGADSENGDMNSSVGKFSVQCNLTVFILLLSDFLLQNPAIGYPFKKLFLLALKIVYLLKKPISLTTCILNKSLRTLFLNVRINVKSATPTIRF